MANNYAVWVEWKGSRMLLVSVQQRHVVKFLLFSCQSSMPVQIFTKKSKGECR